MNSPSSNQFCCNSIICCDPDVPMAPYLLVGSVAIVTAIAGGIITHLTMLQANSWVIGVFVGGLAGPLVGTGVATVVKVCQSSRFFQA